MDLIHKSSLNM